MSCVLPPEILDLIVDHLHDEPTTLRTCCFVSRSWVPRTRRHLFADIEFGAIVQPPIELWKKAFPDPSNSPAHYTRNLSIYGVTVVTAANAGVGGWIPAFQNIVHLRLERLDRASLIPFYGLSPTIRSLHLTRCTVEVFDLISSFPFLEDLALDDLHPESDADGWSAPVTSPKLTGTLDLCMRDARPVARRLLDLPGGLHFSRINTTFSDDDADSVADLVSRCSDTLEFLNILYWSPCAFPSDPVIDSSSPHPQMWIYLGRVSLTSARPQNSNTWGFCGMGQPPSGSSRRSKQSNPKTLNISPSTKMAPSEK